MKRRAVNIKSKPRDVIDLRSVRDSDGRDWLPGECKRIVQVVYHPMLNVPVMEKIRVERAADSTFWIVCPVCSEHTDELKPGRRGLCCPACYSRMGGPRGE